MRLRRGESNAKHNGKVLHMGNWHSVMITTSENGHHNSPFWRITFSFVFPFSSIHNQRKAPWIQHSSVLSSYMYQGKPPVLASRKHPVKWDNRCDMGSPLDSTQRLWAPFSVYHSCFIFVAFSSLIFLHCFRIKVASVL